MVSLQHSHMLPPPIDAAASATRRDSEASPTRSSFQSSNASRIHTPSTSIPSTPIISTRPTSPEKRTLRPGESDAFLTAVAAQERRVLELKEELQKAEGDLGKLKKEWAAHEAKKKRNESRNAEQLQPLKTSFQEYNALREDSPGSVCKDLDRRKTLSSGAKVSQRKVFSGSRHTRTLSLLSPNNNKADPHYPPRGDSLNRNREDSQAIAETVPEMAVADTTSKRMNAPSKGPDRDLIIETGKQLVGDFRQGFWTFVEDLKQVTVGDESSPVVGTGISPKSSINESRKVVPKGKDVNGVYTAASKQKSVSDGRSEEAVKDSQEHTVARVEDLNFPPNPTLRSQHGLAISTDSDGEGWEAWDTNGQPD